MGINVLPEHLANMIAAGEVVERPASIVKELVENSIDAGANNITIEIKGIEYIRVTDNGSGMEKNEVKEAFKRHATSKISKINDIFSIGTLGFRGEALPSIAAVSRCEILSKKKGEIEGRHVICEQNVIITDTPAGCPEGTTVVVRDLFKNTPARLNFLKKERIEIAYVTEVIENFILSHSDISFSYIKNNKQNLISRGNQNLKDSIITVYGADYTKSIVLNNYEDDEIKVYGYIGKPTLSKPNRNFEKFFINKRFIKNKVLSYAVEEAYRNKIMKYPFFVLFIFLEPSLIDINVHPSKLEVKFLREHEAYSAVYNSVKETLEKNIGTSHNATPLPYPSSYTPNNQSENKKYMELLKDISYLNKNEVKTDKNIVIEKTPTQQTSIEDKHLLIENINLNQTYERLSIPKIEPGTQELTQNNEILDENTNIFKKLKSFKYIGNLFNTYVLIEAMDELFMIDQHAAQERLIFDELLNMSDIKSQFLITPQVMEFSKHELELIKIHSSFLYELGFEIEEFGNNSVITRQIPSNIGLDDAAPLISEILTIIKFNKDTTHLKEKSFYQIACKAAVKANQYLHKEEVESLIASLSNLKNDTCPHGRPIIISIPKKNIEKQFRRIL